MSPAHRCDEKNTASESNMHAHAMRHINRAHEILYPEFGEHSKLILMQAVSTDRYTDNTGGTDAVASNAVASNAGASSTNAGASSTNTGASSTSAVIQHIREKREKIDKTVEERVQRQERKIEQRQEEREAREAAAKEAAAKQAKEAQTENDPYNVTRVLQFMKGKGQNLDRGILARREERFDRETEKDAQTIRDIQAAKKAEKEIQMQKNQAKRKANEELLNERQRCIEVLDAWLPGVKERRECETFKQNNQSLFRTETPYKLYNPDEGWWAMEKQSPP
jgi:hypothetical protein